MSSINKVATIRSVPSRSDAEILYDGHIHMPTHWPAMKDMDSPARFAAKAKRAGITGGMIISPPPRDRDLEAPVSNAERMDAVLDYCGKLKNFYPCYWINPTEPDAVRQVVTAKEKGIRALKVICSFHEPAAGLECYRMAAQLDMPILFHSGSLWDGEVFARFNRPANWECMLDVYGCRFCLAHISWPWQSECLALFGKINQANFTRKDRKCDMYVDCSPGTPECDREDIFRRFGLLGYDLSSKLIWGVDSGVANYSYEYAKWIYDWDVKMFKDLQKKWGRWKAFRCTGSFMAAQQKSKNGPERDFNAVIHNAMHKNLLRFLGEKTE
jgi:predicted TIM-barrel fold metal-dependent hydrolase